MNTVLEAVTFPPTGDVLWARRDDDGRVFVAVKPIVAAIGLAWNGQWERIKRSPVLAEGIRMIRTPSAGGEQQTLCLPLDMIPGWLMGIDVNRVKAGLRVTLIAFQRECYRVLAAHFGLIPPAEPAPAVEPFLPAPEPEDAQVSFDAQPLFGMSEREARLKVDMVREARLLKGPAAALRLWNQFGFPGLEDRTPSGGVGDEPGFDAFLEACTEPGRGATITGRALYQAYVAWCAGCGRLAVSETRFGREAKQRLRSRLSGHVFYYDIRLKG
jgi:hypothetical protein